MIGVIFEFGSDIIEVRVVGKSVLFKNNLSPLYSDISGLKLNKEGAIKEFPDLKDNLEWKKEVIKRFKQKIKNMENEQDIIKYIIEDLTKFGYQAKYIQKAGHRVIKL